MTDYFSKVKEFHEAFRHPDQSPTPQRPTLFPESTDEANARLHALRLKLVFEEAEELRQALEESNIVEVADACADLMYVVAGCAISFGINLDLVFDEVHSSNLSKLDRDGKPIFREDGKVMKTSPNYRPPNVAAIIQKQIDSNSLDQDQSNV